MPFRIPTFNIVVEIQHMVEPGVFGPPVSTPAQLRGLTRFYASGGAIGPNLTPALYVILLPPRTDVRDSGTSGQNDRVRVPGWLGDPATVAVVWDVAYGFPNEYRCAGLLRRRDLGTGMARLPGQGPIPGA